MKMVDIRNPIEAEEQKALFEWASYHPVGDYLFAIPNGGSRHIIEARNLKLQGVKAGVPDIFLAIPLKGRGGLFIELKRKKGGKVSNNQNLWIERLENIGYMVSICFGWEEARDEILNYLEGNYKMAKIININNILLEK